MRSLLKHPSNVPEVIAIMIQDMNDAESVQVRSNYYLRLKDIAKYINQELRACDNAENVFQKRSRNM